MTKTPIVWHQCEDPGIQFSAAVCQQCPLKIRKSYPGCRQTTRDRCCALLRGRVTHTTGHLLPDFAWRASNAEGGSIFSLRDRGPSVAANWWHLYFPSSPSPAPRRAGQTLPAALGLWLEGIAVIPAGLARPALKRVIQIEGIQHIDRQIFSM